jgi:hypothetical protein
VQFDGSAAMSITPMKNAFDPAPSFLREPSPDEDGLSYPSDAPAEEEARESRWRVGKAEPEKAGGKNMRFVLIAGIVLAGMLIFLAGMFTGAALVSPYPADGKSAGSASPGRAPVAQAPGSSETLMAPRAAVPAAKAPAKPAVTPGGVATAPAAPAAPKSPAAAVPAPAAPAAPAAETAAPADAAPAAPAKPVMAPPPVAEAPAPAAPAAPKLDSLTPPKPPAPIAGAGEKADVPAAPPLEQLARDLEQQAPVAPKVLSKPAEAPAPAGEFTIQMGAFSSKANADRLAAKFKGQDIEAYVASGKDSRGRTLYYVRSGSFDSREKARAAADRVKKVSGSAAIVTRPGKGDIRL